MTRWEYRIEVGIDPILYDQQKDIERAIARFNAMGQEGWELVSTNGVQNGDAMHWLATYKRATD